MSLRTSAEIVLAGDARPRAGADAFPMANGNLNYGWANTLIEAATPNQDRENLALVDYDFHRTITSIGRRNLFSAARTLFWRIPALQAAILEQAELAVSPYTPRYIGRNQRWGDNAGEWLNGWHQVMCLEGWPNDYDSFAQFLIVSDIVDGEIHTLLTQDQSNNARVQFIPTHRIGSRWQTGGVAKVRYEGNTLSIDGRVIDDSLPFTFAQPVEWEAPIVDGVIVDAQMRAIAYRVYSDPVSSSTWIDISARSLFPTFQPFAPGGGQLHGISLLASSVFDFQDVRESRSYELLAQKTFASKTVVEHNDTADTDSAAALVSQGATFNSDGSKATPDVIKLARGAYTYFKSNSGGKLEAFNWGDRPSRSAQDFQEQTVRDAFRGFEWDMFFGLDPKTVGGAPMRVIVDRINRVLRKRRRMAGKTILRVHRYALAKAMANGDLPFDVDWNRWSYSGPPDVTADRRYDAETDLMEYERGWSTLADIEARRNGDWQAKRQQREIEAMDLYERAQRIAQRFSITIQEAAAQLQKPSTTASLSIAPDQSGDKPQPKEDQQ